MSWASLQLEGEQYLQMLSSVCECLWVTAINAQEVRKLETITLFGFLWLRYCAIRPDCRPEQFCCGTIDCGVSGRIRHWTRAVRERMDISRPMIFMILAYQCLNRSGEMLLPRNVDELLRDLARRAREGMRYRTLDFWNPWRNPVDYLATKYRFSRVYRSLIQDKHAGGHVGARADPYYKRLGIYIRLLAQSSGKGQVLRQDLYNTVEDGPLHYNMSPIPEVALDSSTNTAESSTQQTGAHPRSRLSITLARSTISSLSSLRSQMRLAERLRQQNGTEHTPRSSESMDHGSRRSSWSFRRVTGMSWGSSQASVVMHDVELQAEDSTMMDSIST